MRLLVIPLALAISSLAAGQPADPAGGRIVGEWRGTSICTNHELAPACKDEIIRYVFTGPAKAKKSYHLVADKLVSGKYETMGEMDFEYSGADSTWSCGFSSPRCPKCTWWYRIEKSGLVGGITSGSGDALRKVSAKRYVP
jgi:hypothetical protein